jgi:hypothetical protein
MPFTIVEETDTCHPLTLLRTHENGDEEWGCDECGHTRLINWGAPPVHKNIMTYAGDFYARHCCSARSASDAGVDLTISTWRKDTDEAPTPPYTPKTYTCSSCRPRRN